MPGRRERCALRPGQECYLRRMTKGQPSGIEVTNRYSTGAVQSTGSMLDEEMHGTWEFFRKDGTIMRSGQFDRGTQVGVWRTFDRTGRLVKETRFTDGG